MVDGAAAHLPYPNEITAFALWNDRTGRFGVPLQGLPTCQAQRHVYLLHRRRIPRRDAVASVTALADRFLRARVFPFPCLYLLMLIHTVVGVLDLTLTVGVQMERKRIANGVGMLTIGVRQYIHNHIPLFGASEEYWEIVLTERYRTDLSSIACHQ